MHGIQPNVKCLFHYFQGADAVRASSLDTLLIARNLRSLWKKRKFSLPTQSLKKELPN